MLENIFSGTLGRIARKKYSLHRQNKPKTIFDQIAAENGFLYIDVFGGNNPKNLQKAYLEKIRLRNLPAKRPITYVLETDVCWTNDQGQLLLYTFHPNLNHLLPFSAKEVAQMEKKGKLFLLEDLMKEAQEMHFCFHLKDGKGSLYKAIETLLAAVGEKKQDSWFYSYNPLSLQMVNHLDQEAALSLRTFTYHGQGIAALIPSSTLNFPFVDLFHFPVETLTVTSYCDSKDILQDLSQEMSGQNRYLIFGSLRNSRQDFALAYGGAGIGANMNKLRLDDVFDLL